MPQWGLIAINSIVAGLIAGAGAVLAVIGSDGKLDQTAWIIAVCTALVAAGKDWLSYMQVPLDKASKVAGVALLALCLGGCVTPAMIQEMAKDSATFCGKVTTVYGQVEYARSNIASGSVKCNGLEISAPGTALVPVTIKPVTP